MILTYTCIRKCFFMEAIRNPGDKMVLDTSVGDQCVHLVPTPTEEQLAMQAQETKQKSAEVSVPKAEAKAVSRPKTTKPSANNGGKAK